MRRAASSGDTLENAVRVLETVILKENPSYQEHTFRIEGRKTVQVSGVRHEIDI